MGMVPLSALTRFEALRRARIHHLRFNEVPIGAIERRGGARIQFNHGA